MPRKSPVRHHVDSHRRSRANVTDHNRGAGSRSISVTELKQRQRRGTVDEHGRKLKKIGENISYLDNGRRVSGIVVGIRVEYYLVERNGKVWKVDRHSIFSRLGSALKGKAGRESDAVERANWNRWKKEMEDEEKDVLRSKKLKAKADKERLKFREKIRRGPRIKRTANIFRVIVSEETSKAVKEAKMKVLEKSLGKERARRAVKRFREAEKKERRQRIGRG